MSTDSGISAEWWYELASMRKFIPYQQLVPTSIYFHVLRNLGLTFILKGKLHIMWSPHELAVSCLWYSLAVGRKEAIKCCVRAEMFEQSAMLRWDKTVGKLQA